MKKVNIRTILVAPLDWGLGHATRCIPIINTLSKDGFNVIVACNHKQKILLEAECNNVEFVHLNGYNIKYTKHRLLFALTIFLQIPKIIASINKEHKWLNKIIKHKEIDLVISDNRYGLYHSKIPCVFITHQLTVKAPFRCLENLLQTINYRYLNRFNQCWIPDHAGKENVAGLLSHPKKLPKATTHYVGLLNRFNRVETAVLKFDVCVLLSGPEPQRTILESIILKQFNNVENLKIFFIRGLPHSTEKLQSSKIIEIVNHLNQKDLLDIICSSEIIIARSGYTTIMEIIALQKKSILIPTPGQTEQEYLAKHLSEQKLCLSYSQNKIDVLDAINVAKKFEYKFLAIQNSNENNILNLVNNIIDKS